MADAAPKAPKNKFGAFSLALSDVNNMFRHDIAAAVGDQARSDKFFERVTERQARRLGLDPKSDKTAQAKRDLYDALTDGEKAWLGKRSEALLKAMQAIKAPAAKPAPAP